MKTIYSTLLFIFLFLHGRAQTTPAPTFNDNVKKSANESAQAAVGSVIKNGLRRAVNWMDTIPTHLQNVRNKKRTDKLNKNRCADTLECRLDSMAQVLAADAQKHHVKRIAVFYFNDTITKLGIKMAEKLSIALALADDSLQIIDRQHIDAILQEHKLAADGIVDPATAKVLGRLLQADAIVTGSIRVWKNVINIDVKMLDVETGQILGGGPFQIPMSKDYSIKKAVAGELSSTAYPLPPGFYFIPGAPVNCAEDRSGQLVVNNLTGKDILVNLQRPYDHQYTVMIKAGESFTFKWLRYYFYNFEIREAGNNSLIRQGEIIIRTCEHIGLDVR